ncbi:MAG: hypothetical protein GW799_20075 [Shewanella frigidimarina]|nr:hypothetical protein [Shewanella frigidimarina]
MDEVIGIALVLTIIVAAIIGASFWQGVGIFVVMFFVAAAYCNEVYKK